MISFITLYMYVCKLLIKILEKYISNIQIQAINNIYNIY